MEHPEVAQPEAPTPAIAGAEVPRGALIWILLGALLFLAAIAIGLFLEGGPGEFGYRPFDPRPVLFAAMRGFTAEQLVLHGAGLLLAAPGLWLIGLALRNGQEAAAPSVETVERIALASALASLAAVTFFLFFVLRGKAITDDELAYYFQADLLGHGKLAFAGLPHVDQAFVIKTRLGFAGKYLPGEPSVQALGVLLGHAAVVHIPLVAWTLWAFHRAVRLLADRLTAAWAVVFLAVSPMLILTSATGQSQASSLAAVVTAVLGYALLWKSERRVLGTLLVGVGIAFGVAVRIQVAVPVGVVVVPLALWRLRQARAWGPLVLLLTTLAVGAAGIGAYNAALTGSPLTLPWSLDKAGEHYGFGRVFGPNDARSLEHTFGGGLFNLAVVALRLNAWWLGWPCSFVVAWLWWRNGRSTQGGTVWFALGLATLLFEFGYYSTGVSDTGPVYHYELLLPGAIIGANAIREAMTRNARATLVLLFVQFGLGSASFLWLQERRIERLVHAIHADIDASLAKVQAPALILYETRCGETVAHGWVNEQLPFALHADDAPIVAWQRPPAKYLQPMLDYYRNRTCWYFHVEPMTQGPALLSCADAGPLLTRRLHDSRDTNCLWVEPTASLLKWYDPSEIGRERAAEMRQNALKAGTGEPVTPH